MPEIAGTERIRADGASVRSHEGRRRARLVLARSHLFHEIGEDSSLGQYRDATLVDARQSRDILCMFDNPCTVTRWRTRGPA